MRTRPVVPTLLAAACLSISAVLAACGGGGTEQGSAFDPRPDAGEPAYTDDAGDASLLGEPPEAITQVFFDPPAATLQVDGVTAKTQAFTLKGKGPSGRVRDVLAESAQFDRPDLAKLAGGPPTSLTASGQYAGTGTLQAVFRGLVASASLTVEVHVRELGAGVTPAAASALDAPGLPPDPRVASLLYPYDKTLFPLGLSSPLVMWTAPAGSSVYRLRYEQKGYVHDAYALDPRSARMRVSQAAWDRVTMSNGGDPVKVTLSRWDAAQGKAFASASQSWTIVPASLRGAIYYWTTSQGGHLARIRPGTGAKPETLNGGKCMGCHAVSADGSTLVASVEDQVSNDAPNDGKNRAWVSFDLPSGAVRKASSQFAGNVALTPEGKYTVFGFQQLHIADTATGTRIQGSGLETAPAAGTDGFMTPAFSPDGRKLAVIEGSGSYYHNLVDGRLVVLDFDPTTLKFSNRVNLAAAAAFPAAQRGLSYPTFTPDSKAVAFHVGDYTTGCDEQGCDDAAAQLGAIWLQGIAGGAPVKLKALSDSTSRAADSNVSYEPTFNPVERGGYYWVVFTSSRDWGNKITGPANNGKKRLWVAAVDKVIGAADPSHPPFFLEGQDETTTNMRGFWALAACKTSKPAETCSAGFECCSGFCDRGVCVETTAVACRAVGGRCEVDVDCCNSPAAVTCTAGSCQPVIPK